MAEYRVNLDVYNGPIDLLLYLIRREEVDIYDIPIARITEQYVHYVQMLEALDPNVMGDFLVMAATLMEIKTRMLLPAAPAEEGGADGLEIDPRAELVRQLLEYKNFKDAAGDLRDSAQLQAMKFPRRPGAGPDETQQADIDLEDAQVWHLLDAFDGLMTAIGQRITEQEVIYDDTPVELHVADIVDMLQRQGGTSFARLFEGRTSRSELVGLFLALLELVRRKIVLASQDRDFGDIHVHLNPEPPDPDEDDDPLDADEPDEPSADDAATTSGYDAEGLAHDDNPARAAATQEPADGSGAETQGPGD